MKDKKVRFVIKINKDEVNYLLSQGFNFPEHLHKTHTSHPTYYVTENKAYKALQKYRESLLVK